MDITCCDSEPAVLARNILLFTLLENHKAADVVGSIFYHFKLSQSALNVLTNQSKLLYELSGSMEAWVRSSYGSFLKFLDARTLSLLRRHWKYYMEFTSIPNNRLNKLRLQQVQFSKSVLKKFAKNLGPGRSAGMMWKDAVNPINNAFKKYWKTGTTFISDEDIDSATSLNPTFLYSLSGEMFCHHDQTFPQGFHLAPAFMPIMYDPVHPNLVDTKPSAMDLSKLQFHAWCNAFTEARKAGALTIRFYSGDALALCRALDIYNSSGCTAPDLLNSPWGASKVNLDQIGTQSSPLPTLYDVIDTSNLGNYVGLLNLLLVSQPILKTRPFSKSVLYTEELTHAQETGADPFLKRLCASVPTLSTLIGLAPLDHLSDFTSHSNVHEPLTGVSQCMERTTWVDPTSGDPHRSLTQVNLAFDAHDLAHIMFGIYQHILCFSQDVSVMLGNPMLLMSRIRQGAFHHPETLSILFQLVKRRVCVKHGTWDSVASRFFSLVEGRESRPVEREKTQNLHLQLHLGGVHTPSLLKPDWLSDFAERPLSIVFRGWDDIPPVLCVVLTVPRECIIRVLGKENKVTGSPALQCNLRNGRSVGHSYTSVRCVWGTCRFDRDSNSWILKEDLFGADGESDLVVSFWAAAHVLAYETKTVGFGIVPTHDAMVHFLSRLGEPLELFTAELNDPAAVKVLSLQPSLASEGQPVPQPTIARLMNSSSQDVTNQFLIGTTESDNHVSVVSYTYRLEINSLEEQRALLNGASPSVTQISPCTMQVVVDQQKHNISYPYPILGFAHKLRIARKSHYLEVIVPVSKPLDFGGYCLNRTPVLQRNPHTPWNIHHINLNRMPLLDTTGPSKLTWLNYHTGLQMSDRERSIMRGTLPIDDQRTKIMPAIKDTVHSILNDYAGFWNKREVAFGLCEPNDASHFYAVLLVGGLRIDLASFTIIADTAVIPTTESTAPMIFPFLNKYMKTNPLYTLTSMGDEATAWKNLLPAFIERARTWEHTPNCEYKIAGRVPISYKKGDDVFCFCGTGKGFDGDMWKVAGWKPLIPFATRAAISPLFYVPYLESSDQLIVGLQQMMANGCLLGMWKFRQTQAAYLCQV
ncbi:MYND Zn-finger protein [Ceratobasidium sp. AG-Ba]|nr:MYND Zn-finger protein [Ceratobasidium sp. AG-Ba]